MHQLQDGLHRVQELARSGLLLRRCLSSFTVMNNPVKRLKSERLKRKYTQADIADCMEVSESTVSRWETGQIEMTYPEMQRYAAAIGIDQYWFFAFLASDEIGVLPPFITVEVGAFTEKGYAEILKIVQELGPKHLIVNGTKQYQYGNNSSRKPSLSRADG